MSNGKSFTAATVQAAPVFLDKKGTVDKVTRLIKEAAGNGAELIAFPEAFHPHLSLLAQGSRVRQTKKNSPWTPTSSFTGTRSRFPERIRKESATAARKAKACVVIGVNEKEGGTLYNTILYFGKDGSLLGRHRKLMSIDSEKMRLGEWNRRGREGI